MRPAFDQLARSFAGPFAFCGIAVEHGGVETVHTAAAPGIKANAASLFRVASVSKVVTGLTLLETMRHADLHAGFDLDVSDILGWSLRHPIFPDVPITLRMLASHSSGIVDDAGYAVNVSSTLQHWIGLHDGAIFANARPGTRFCYTNLGFILLAACIERLGQARFDLRARSYVLTPLNMLGGFNWAGVSAKVRRRALPTYRRVAGKFVPQVDANVAPEGLLGPDGVALPHDRYSLGLNPAIFAPQGGLRLTLRGMLRLAQALPRANLPVLWSPEMGETDNPDALFDQYGPGVQILRAPNFYPRPLVGHFGSAYGFKGGIWHDPEAGTSFAYALNGLAENDESDALCSAECAIFDAIAARKG